MVPHSAAEFLLPAVLNDNSKLLLDALLHYWVAHTGHRLGLLQLHNNISAYGVPNEHIRRGRESKERRENAELQLRETVRQTVMK